MHVEQIQEALREVIDPEIGINIVDLGLVYSIDVQDGSVRIAVTMTTRACPLSAYIVQEVEAAVRRALPDVQRVDVQMVWDPPWCPAMMSEAAKQRLGWRS